MALSFEELRTVPLFNMLTVSRAFQEFDTANLQHFITWLAVAWVPGGNPMDKMNREEIDTLLSATKDEEKRHEIAFYAAGRHCAAMSLTKLIKQLFEIDEEDTDYDEEISNVARRFAVEALGYDRQQLEDLISLAYQDEKEQKEVLDSFQKEEEKNA